MDLLLLQEMSEIVWGDGEIPLDIEARWCNQGYIRRCKLYIHSVIGFSFSETEPTALVQKNGGPCGVIAPVQVGNSIHSAKLAPRRSCSFPVTTCNASTFSSLMLENLAIFRKIASSSDFLTDFQWNPYHDRRFSCDMYYFQTIQIRDGGQPR